MEEVVGQDVYKTWKTEAEAAAKRWRDRTAFELFQEPSIKLAQEKYNGRVESKYTPVAGAAMMFC